MDGIEDGSGDFNFFNKQIKKDFGKTASKETFAKFASYCAEGIEKMELSQFLIG